MSRSHLHRMAANTLIMGLCRSRALGLYMIQHPKALTLCWHSVDTLLMLCWRSVDSLLTRSWCSVDAHFEVQRYRHTQYCLWWLPILWLCINAVAQPLDYTRCNTQNRWRSVDNLLMLCWCSVDNLLTLCWRSFWGVAVSTHTILPIKAANTSIMGKCRITALGIYKVQHPTLLTLCWCSFSDGGWDHVSFSFAHQGCQYVDNGYQWANGIPMDLLTRSKTIDAPLRLTFRMWLLPCRCLFCL